MEIKINLFYFHRVNWELQGGFCVTLKYAYVFEHKSNAMKTLLLLCLLIYLPVSCLSKGLYETYQYKLILVGVDGKPLTYQHVNIVKNGQTSQYQTDKNGIIMLEIVCSTKCPSTMNAFNRIFNNRPEWTSKHFEIEYDGIHHKIRKNWKRVFRNRTAAVQSYSLSKKKFI